MSTSRNNRARWPNCDRSLICATQSGLRRNPPTASPLRVEGMRRADNQIGFAVIAHRWLVKRIFVWINRTRRLAKEGAATIASAKPSCKSFTLYSCCDESHVDQPIHVGQPIRYRPLEGNDHEPTFTPNCSRSEATSV